MASKEDGKPNLLFGKFTKKEFFDKDCELVQDAGLQALCLMLKRAVCMDDRAIAATQGTLYRVLCKAEEASHVSWDAETDLVEIASDVAILALWEDAVDANMADWGTRQLNELLLPVHEMKFDNIGSRTRLAQEVRPRLQTNAFEVGGVSLMSPGGSKLLAAEKMKCAPLGVSQTELNAIGVNFVDGEVSLAEEVEVATGGYGTALLATPVHRIPTTPRTFQAARAGSAADGWLNLARKTRDSPLVQQKSVNIVPIDPLSRMLADNEPGVSPGKTNTQTMAKPQIGLDITYDKFPTNVNIPVVGRVHGAAEEMQNKDSVRSAYTHFGTRGVKAEASVRPVIGRADVTVVRLYEMPVPEMDRMNFYEAARQFRIRYKEMSWTQLTILINTDIQKLLMRARADQIAAVQDSADEIAQVNILGQNYLSRVEPHQRKVLMDLWNECYSAAERTVGWQPTKTSAENNKQQSVTNATLWSHPSLTSGGGMKQENQQGAGLVNGGMSNERGDDRKSLDVPGIRKMNDKAGTQSVGKQNHRASGYGDQFAGTPQQDVRNIGDRTHVGQDNVREETGIMGREGNFVPTHVQDGRMMGGRFYQDDERSAQADNAEADRQEYCAPQDSQVGQDRGYNDHEGRYDRGSSSQRTNLSMHPDMEMRFKDISSLLGKFTSNDGDETWSEYFMGFMQTMEELAVRPEVRGRLLSSVLRGKARVQQFLMASKDRFNFEKLVAMMDRSFDTEVEREMARSALPRRMQQPDETIRHFADAIFTIARRAYSGLADNVIREERVKEQLWNGITDGAMRSRLRDYRDNHPGCSTQEAVDHLSLHDSRDGMAKIPAMAMDGVNALFDCYGVEDSSSSDGEYEYFQERLEDQRGSYNNSYPRGPRRGGGFRRRTDDDGGIENRPDDKGPVVRGEGDRGGLANRGGRSGLRGRDVFIGQDTRFLTYGGYISILEGLKRVAIRHRDGKFDDPQFTAGGSQGANAPSRVIKPEITPARGSRGNWRSGRAGVKPYQGGRTPEKPSETYKRANLCRSCGLFTPENLVGKCAYGETHYCKACGDDMALDCLVCINDEEYGVRAGQTFSVNGEQGNA